jgi:ferredoxin
MAELAKRLAANVAGDFYVDASCIDCGTCRQVAPETFAEGRDASYVNRQPADEAQSHRARMALVACPSRRSRATARAAISSCGAAATSSSIRRALPRPS